MSSAATRSGDQGFTDRRTLGYYAEQQLAIHDQLFLTGGVRRDAASAFGPKTKAVYYPKLGASWMASEQSFVPKPTWMNSLRLRVAYGASGQIPLATDAIRYFRSFSTTLGDGSNAAGASLSSIGDAYLRPEYSAETEFGFDLTMFSGHTNLELTSYDKKTRDALISRNIAPSLAGVTSQLTNIGNVRNTGVELTLNQRVIDRKQIAIELTLTGSTNKNRLGQLGRGVSPIASGNRNTQRDLSGYPMFGLWDRAIGFTDANQDGIIVLGELTFSDTSVFQGPTFPGRELAFTPRIELLNHRLRLSSQFDSKWGMIKFNNTLRAECANNASCRGRNDPSAPLAMQAGALATTQTVFTGMFEDGAFTRWREASVSYEMPATWAHAIRADRWAVVFTGRNLGVRTRYSGVDPEAAVSSGDTRGGEEYFSTPPLRYYTLRMNFGF